MGDRTDERHARQATKDLAKTIGDTVRRTRAAKSLSQEVLAERIGTSAQAVSLIETGTTTPRLPTLVSLARVLDVPIAQFFTDAVIDRDLQVEQQMLELLRQIAEPSDRRLAVSLVRALVEAKRSPDDPSRPAGGR